METKKMEALKINIKKTDAGAKIPTKGSQDCAGYDLYSNENVIVYEGERELIKTGVCIEIPPGYYGRIAPRSGLALKHGIDTMAGVIDADFRGEIGVILLNTDKSNIFRVSKGDRIAQIIFEKCMNADFLEAENLKESVRAEGGFGSSGR